MHKKEKTKSYRNNLLAASCHAAQGLCFNRLAALILLLLSVLVSLPAAAQDTPSLTDKQIILNFRDVPLGDVLDYLSEQAGLIVVSDVAMDTRVTIISKNPLSIDEAVSLIDTVLKDSYLAAVRTQRTLRIVSIEQARYMNLPVSSGSDPAAVVGGDNVITHIIPIRYANAVNLREDLSSLLPDYAVLSANEASNSLIITDTSANVKRLIEIVRAVDTQMSSVADVRVFHLVYADAEDTADLVNRVFEQEQARSTNRDSTNPFQRMMNFGRGGSSPRDSSRGSNGGQSTGNTNVRITAAADRSSNSVVISAPNDTMDVIAEIIKELDSNPESEQMIFVYTLKNAQAPNIKKVLNNLFEELKDLKNQASGRNNNVGRGSSSSRSAGSDLSEDFYVEADADTNSLLIMTSQKNYAKIEPVLDELDKIVPQVLIKVLIAEVTTSDGLDLGTEFSVLNMRSSGGETLFGTEFLPDNMNGFMTRTLEGDLDFTIRALQEIGDLNVLSRPYILTSNNQKATITVGQEVPFVTDTRVTETGQTINSISYEDIGIILEVTPTINNESLVIMDVKPEISTMTGETVLISDNVEAAVYAKRSTNSRVAVANGQTIVIGGLMQDKDTDTIEKVPLLGDIPLLGLLFQRNRTKTEKTELLIFLTPLVAQSGEDLENISNQESSRSKILNDPQKYPSLQEHMNNMQSPVETH
ncbi:Putative general secretion pathway protein D [Limihaloglobus sulfuriphilus]|uniref:Putative general secretion pathway protein D n=1 Tax=Limihaloglobus sulfuriphilus TaxID=1851148 RepID=A0A1Q2MFD3_9BACT|nr:type II secretion system secretin GspD [Limihaloglobus sulfuriphilus]AQQ71380.1 Putative general secretion pathway protein D [Limihaloglobus sulfuriphilus]